MVAPRVATLSIEDPIAAPQGIDIEEFLLFLEVHFVRGAAGLAAARGKGFEEALADQRLPGLAVVDNLAVTLTTSPNTAPRARMTGPKCNPIRASNGPFRQLVADLTNGRQRHLRALEKAEYVIALRVDEVTTVLGDIARIASRHLKAAAKRHRADALIEGRAAHDIS